MTIVRRYPLWILLALPMLTGCPGFGDEEPPSLFAEVPDVPTYQEHIKPLMEARCVECHADTPTLGAPDGFRLDVLEDTGGEGGLRTQAFRSKARMDALTMPPISRPPTTDIERQIFDRWIECGLPDTAADAECDVDEPNNDVNNDDVPLTYEDAILPIFDDPAVGCTAVGCHADASTSGLALGSLDDLQDAANPGTFVPCKPDDSSLVQRLKLEAGDPLLMPQFGAPLPADRVELVERWVREGEDIEDLCEGDDDPPAGLCGEDFNECVQECDDPFSVVCQISCSNGSDCTACIGNALDECSENFCNDEFLAFAPCFQDCRFTDDILGCIERDCADERDAFDTCMEPIIENRNCNEDLLECGIRVSR